MGYTMYIGYLEVFLIVFARVMGLFMSAPFFSGLAMTFRFKLAFTFFISLIAVPLVIGSGILPPGSLPEFGVKLLSNFVFGAGIGFFIYIIITAFQVSAQVFSIQMGMGMNEVFDPISDTQVPALGNLLGIMIIMLLVRIDGHFYMIQIIIDSFKSLDVMSLNTTGMIVKGFVSAVAMMFEVGMKIALPIIGVTIVLDAAMGLIARVAPQFNVMIMGFNIKLIMGFLTLWLMMPPLIDLGEGLIKQILQNTTELVHYMKK